jgi:hypothetical protein
MSGLVRAAQEAALARIDRAESTVEGLYLPDDTDRSPFLRLDALARLDDARDFVMSAGGEVDPIQACRLAASDADGIAERMAEISAALA